MLYAGIKNAHNIITYFAASAAAAGKDMHMIY
jgi:hypothetical protein